MFAVVFRSLVSGVLAVVSLDDMHVHIPAEFPVPNGVVTEGNQSEAKYLRIAG